MRSSTRWVTRVTRVCRIGVVVWRVSWQARRQYLLAAGARDAAILLSPLPYLSSCKQPGLTFKKAKRDVEHLHSIRIQHDTLSALTAAAADGGDCADGTPHPGEPPHPVLQAQQDCRHAAAQRQVGALGIAGWRTAAPAAANSNNHSGCRAGAAAAVRQAGAAAAAATGTGPTCKMDRQGAYMPS